ncbi:MAG: hypothetical protein GY913_01615 [Proteobacteria bacterium]|nr:hypothetical protein [Pseudomonadota bacterium]MCP4915597.1 hypothetical protein [Pseudomonadota bacterium]
MWFLLLACTPEEPPAPAEPVDAERAGHWKRLDELSYGHKGQTTTRLPGEQYVVFGGYSDKAERIDVPAGRVREMSPAPEPRMGHAAAADASGRLVVAGGEVLDPTTGTGEASASVTLWDATTDSWSVGPAMAQARTDHTLSALPDGRLIAIGGLDATGQVLGSTEILGEDGWIAGPSLAAARADHRVDTVGGALIVTGGGVGEVERLAMDQFEALDELDPPRTGHSTVVVGDELLVVGGVTPDLTVLSDVDRLVGGEWVEQAPLWFAREAHGAGRVSDGRVVVVGGRPVAESPDVLPIRDVEILELDGTWTLANRQVSARYEANTVELLDGRVLVVAGNARGKVMLDASVYSPDEKPPRAKQPEDTAPPEPREPDPMGPQPGEPALHEGPPGLPIPPG